MKRSIVVCFCFLFLSAALSLHAQVVPAASSSSLALDAGGFGSGFQPDYAGEGIAQTGPNRLYGLGAYANVRLSRWVQIEGEARSSASINTWASMRRTTWSAPASPLARSRSFRHTAKCLRAWPTIPAPTSAICSAFRLPLRPSSLRFPRCPRPTTSPSPSPTPGPVWPIRARLQLMPAEISGSVISPRSAN